MSKLKLFFIMVLTIVSATSWAQEEIETDRPGQGENTSLVKPKEFQAETGVSLNHFEDAPPAVIGNTLIRYGVSDNLEFRVRVEEGTHSLMYFQESAQALYPIAVGTKFGLIKDKKILPDITLVSYLNLPVLSHPDENEYWAPAFVLSLEKKFGKFTFESTEGIKWDNFEKGHSWQATGALNFDIAEKWKIFGEYYGQYEEGSAPGHNLDGGLLYCINKNVQLDICAGSSICTGKTNSFGALGFSFKIAKGRKEVKE